MRMYHCICNKNVERNFFCTKSDPFTLLSHALGSRTDVNEGGHQPQGITTTTYNDYLSQQVHRLVSSFILKASSTQQLQKHIHRSRSTCPHDHFANHQYVICSQLLLAEITDPTALFLHVGESCSISQLSWAPPHGLTAKRNAKVFDLLIVRIAK